MERQIIFTYSIAVYHFYLFYRLLTDKHDMEFDFKLRAYIVP
jgi:hypothetical protein